MTPKYGSDDRDYDDDEDLVFHVKNISKILISQRAKKDHGLSKKTTY